MGTHTTIDEILETLILSARYGDGEDIAACLDAGVNVNGQDERGSTGTLYHRMKLSSFLVKHYR